MTDLALFGGPRAVSNPLRKYNPIGAEELTAASEVVSSGVLSQFLGCLDDDFYGGPKVREFEGDCASYFKVKHAITVNSWTSGLIAAVGSIGIEPGDEIIVTPWTMSASATAILHWNAIPVFADIDCQSYNLDPVSVENCISPYTKAIISVDIFGQSADMTKILDIAKRYNLKVISDSAQSPGAFYKDSYAGTFADIGGFSLNYHKHIHTGEGGVLVTNDDVLADKLKLIRNHAEVVVSERGDSDITNMVGSNFRLGEIECAIGIQQLQKLDALVKTRQDIASYLIKNLSTLPGLSMPFIGPDNTHVFYVFAMQFDSHLLRIHKDKVVAALRAEGVPISSRYQNIHLLATFQRKIAYGSNGFPWTSDICHRDISYQKGICPVAESLNDDQYIGLGLCAYDFDRADLDAIINAFKKVWSSLDLLISSSEQVSS